VNLSGREKHALQPCQHDPLSIPEKRMRKYSYVPLRPPQPLHYMEQ
jgi:hypothetical protein